MTDEKDECFETEMGVPTFTVELPNEQRMFPYNSFRNAVLRADRITIELYDWEIAIAGKRLGSLWKQLQLQDVRVIRINPDTTDGQCAISDIEIRLLEAEPEEQDV